MKPLCIDLFCGLGGWAEGFLAEGYRVRGFDVEAHDYGTGGYPGELVLRDVRSIHGSLLKDAAVFVASPPCQEYSYMAMPWKRSKQIAAALLGHGEFPRRYTGSVTVAQLTLLFNECFRIQREACEAAGRYIPLVVENVRGAQKWVGRARWNYGSFYLWGDVPALMPLQSTRMNGSNGQWFPIGKNGERVENFNPVNLQMNGQKLTRHINIRDGHTHTRHLTNQRESDAARQIDPANKPEGFTQTAEMKRQHIGYSRKAASAIIAKIPFPLAQWIARAYKPAAEAVG